MFLSLHFARANKLSRTLFRSYFIETLTERAPVIRALCVLVAGLLRVYPISGVPLLDGGFSIVSKLPLVGALMDALRVFTRGGVDS